MKRNILIPLSVFLLAILLPIIALTVPTSLPAYSDFSAIYNTDLALVHRVPIYDLEQVEALAVQSTNIPPEKFFLAALSLSTLVCVEHVLFGTDAVSSRSHVVVRTQSAHVIPVRLVPDRWVVGTPAVDRLSSGVVLFPRVGSIVCGAI